jgi:hypothetical protein
MFGGYPIARQETLMTTAEARQHLAHIRAGNALSAAVENELEELGLIEQTDAPYAVLTDAGQALVEDRCQACGVAFDAHEAGDGYETCPGDFGPEA